jgi:phage tail sheath protein FI
MATTYLTPGVYVEEVPSSSGVLTAGATAVAAFVGFTEKYPTDDPKDPDGVKPRMVTSWTQFEKLYGGFVKGAMLPLSVYGYFNNGGSLAYIVRIPNTGPSTEPAVLELEAGDSSKRKSVKFTALNPGDDVALNITSTPVDGDDTPTYKIEVLKDDKVEETFEGVTLAPGKNSVDTALGKSKLVKAEPQLDTSKIAAQFATLDTGNLPLKAPPAPIDVGSKDFNGNEAKRTGISGLTIAEDVTMIIVPDLITAVSKDEAGNLDQAGLDMWKSVQIALINHCEGQANRMAILDSPPHMTPQQVGEWRAKEAMYSSAFAALYYPWIRVDNPTGTNGDKQILMPPSGHIAGIWSRNDNERGVWKAPANEIVRGALNVAIDINKAEQGTLNPIGVNCIRPFGTRGIRVWGARTLDDPTGDWVYINVRRLFNMIETTIMNGTQFAVFEPNDARLWAGLTRTVGSFLRGLWRDGALFGATAEQAFYVKCDSETNPQDSIDQGRVVVEVGIAPVKPAEFVIFRIAQIKESAA